MWLVEVVYVVEPYYGWTSRHKVISATDIADKLDEGYFAIAVPSISLEVDEF